MKNFFILSTFFFFNILLHAQVNPNWVTKFEVPFTQMIAIDQFSNTELIAVKTKSYSRLHHVFTINKATGDTTEVLKLDGGSGFKVTALKADFLGNVLIAGTYKKEMRIGAYEKKSETHVTKTFLAKFKPGQAIDTTKIQHFEALETSQLGILPNNEIVLSGYFRYGANILGQQLEAGLDDVFVMKLTPDLQLGWIKNYGEGSDERTSSMHVSKDGNIIVAAKFSHKFNLGEDNTIELLRGNSYGTAIWKMSPSGSIIWHQVFSGYKFGRPEIVKITGDDSFLYLGVTFKGDLLMNRDTLSSMGRQDLSIVRLDQNGKNRQLLMHVKSPYDAQIAGLLSADEELFLAGNFEKRVHIKDELVYAKGDTSRYSAAKEIFYVRFNKQSNQFQLETIGSPNSEVCQTIAMDERNFYLAGTYDKSFEWGTFSLNNQDRKPNAYFTALPRGNGNLPNNDLQVEVDENDGSGGGGHKDPKCPDPDRPIILNTKKELYSLTFRWREIHRAKHYELILANDINMKEVVRSFMHIEPEKNPSLRVGGLDPNQKYFVKVTVENDCEKRAESIVVSAKTKSPEDQEEEECKAPKAPKVYSSEVTNNSAKITCSPVIGGIKYKLVVASDHLFSNVIFKKEYSAFTEKLVQTVTGLRNGQRYYYYVSVENDCPKTTRSETKNFFTLIGGATTREGVCNPTPPVVTKIELENYAFTAYWAGLLEISHYNLYVSNFQDFRDTIYTSKDLKFSTEQPNDRVNKLKGKTDYFFNVVVTKNCKETTAIARSLTRKVTTKCIDDTIIMQDPNQNGPVLFQLVDCEGNLIKMGSIIQDTMVLIDSRTEDPAGILKTLKDSTVATTFKVGPIDLKPLGKCNENQRRVPIQQLDGEIKYECVEIADPRPDSPCMDLATDRDRLICLAKEGVDQAKEVEKEVKRLYKKIINLSAKANLETTTTAEKTRIEQQVREKLLPEHQLFVDSIDKIRTHYEQMMNAIIMNGNISVPVKSEGAGITISPEAVGVYVHWSKYDDSWKLPGPQLVVEVKVSDFPNKLVKVGRIWWKLNAIWNIRGCTYDENGNPISGEGLYGFGPCKAVSGYNSWAIAVLEEYENMGYQKFWDPKMKHFNADVYSQCTGKNFTREHAKGFQNHQIASALVQEEDSTVFGLNQIGFFPTHLFLANTSKIKDVVYSDAFNAYYHAMEKMSDIYYGFYEQPHSAFELLQILRLKVHKNYEKYWYEAGYRIYYGYKEIDSGLARKVRSALN
jgi:hypothetical protein